MTTLTSLIATYLGTYDATVKPIDVPYVTAAVLLVLGCWFAFKVVLVVIHSLAGGKYR